MLRGTSWSSLLRARCTALKLLYTQCARCMWPLLRCITAREEQRGVYTLEQRGVFTLILAARGTWSTWSADCTQPLPPGRGGYRAQGITTCKM